MTIDDLTAEIAILDADIARFEHDIILARGARQAFAYVLEQLRASEQNTDIADAVARQVLDARSGDDHEC